MNTAAAIPAPGHRHGSGRKHVTWAAYGGHKPSWPRPVRPDPDAATWQLERKHPRLVRIMHSRTARYGDGCKPYDQAVFAWESRIWADAGLDQAPLLGATEAQDYAAELWRRYAPRFEPYFSGVPEICVLGEAEAVGGARAKALQHRVLIDQCHCKPAWLAHELMHLCHVHEQHGPGWCAGMVELWEREFDIPRARSLELARQHCVVVADIQSL